MRPRQTSDRQFVTFVQRWQCGTSVRKAGLACLMSLFALLANSPAAIAEQNKKTNPDRTDQFVVFNAMLYENMPAFGDKLPVVYEHTIFKHGVLKDGIRPSEKSVAHAANWVSETAAEAKRQNRTPLVALDIERWHLWPFVPMPEHKIALGHYADSASRFKDAVESPICLYGVLPVGGIITALKAARNPETQQQWVAANKAAAAAISGTVSALCPALYAYYQYPNDPNDERALKQWLANAREVVRQARLLAPDKPIYPFIWPQYHSGGNVRGFGFLSEQRWQAQLEFLKSHTDGLILWGGYDLVANHPLAWDDNASWWRTLKRVFPEQTHVRPSARK
ncbi:MAG: hypothetical protein AB8C46_26265 [Burkholderiaceae bacterium]